MFHLCVSDDGAESSCWPGPVPPSSGDVRLRVLTSADAGSVRAEMRCCCRDQRERERGADACPQLHVQRGELSGEQNTGGGAAATQTQ